MTTEEMKALRRIGFQAWNEGRPELLDEVYAPNCRNHFSGETLDVFKQNIRMDRAAFPDLTVTVDDQIVEGDRDVVRWTARGLHSGEYLGVPATGRRLEQTGITIARFENGRIVEEWSRADDAGLLRQLGVLPDAPAMSSDADRVRAHLFMLRVWAEEPGAAATAWRGKVQSLPDGEAYYFRGWEGLVTHVQRMVAAEKTEYLALDTRGGTVNTIRIVARARIHPGKLEEFTKIAAGCLAATRRDPGTQSYEWYFNADRTECVVLEIYDDSNAVLAHVGNLGDLFGQLMTVSDLTLEVFGDPSPELRQVGDSVGAKVYSYLQGLA